MYRERPSKVWSLICVSLYVAGVAWMGVDSLPEDLGPWLAVSALFLLLLLAFTSVPVSKYFYNRIDLDHTTLRVGRERLALTDLDPASVTAALHRAQQPPGHPFAGADTAHWAGQRPPRLVGGGWAVPMGMDSVTIATRRGEGLNIPARDPEAFLTALASALALQHQA
ncbi:hypothetical protein H8N01_22950 [Streptomyces sp. AC536]|uniref:hypothetical protein n=1 Tax=Streptomyces buecherae TaxID=2763006 RepID=UPI00164EB4C0|nr:hypothetical protein [Streptomyces buecherae]MBC3985356.1 hypothetical protein [Streptomyces buecherae]QNJ41915.1 hypothetical protein H7H31_20635 [Streptomyces buecherae]